MAKTITSWSWSRYDTWRTCPARAKYKFVERLKEPDNPAAAEGTRIHQLGEDFLKDKLKTLPKELTLLKAQYLDAKKRKAAAETDYIYTNKWDPTVWNDWTGAWVRIKADVTILDKKTKTATVADLKTGKQKPMYEEQLELYAVGVMKAYPDMEVVKTQEWYSKTGVVAPGPEDGPDKGVFESQYLPELVKKWEARVKPMMKDTSFKAKPGDHCRWCHFRKANGGPCKY